MKKEDYVFTGNQIRSYRTKHKMSQNDLGEKVGLKGNSISAYERGQVEIPHSKLLAIAEAFDISYLDLLPIEGVENNDTIFAYVQQAKSELDEEQMQFLEELIGQTISLNEEERKNFLKNIKLAVKFYNED